MNEREAQFLRMQEERLEALEKKKAERKEAAQNSEVMLFLKNFGIKKNDIENELRGIVLIKDVANRKEKLNKILSNTMSLQEFLNDSMSFLSPFDLGRSQESLSKIHSDITRIQAEILPRKKFAFGKKKNVTEPKPTPPPSSENLKPKREIKTYTADHIIENKAHETVSLSKSDTYKKDVMLRNLDHCNINIHCPMGTLHCTNLRGCTVHLGPISGSLFLEECLDSEFHVTCQQARIHTTHRTRFYLHVTSKAIIEDCSELQFSKRDQFYEAYESDRIDAGLSDVNNWSEVDDFNWLSSEPSPNFVIV